MQKQRERHTAQGGGGQCQTGADLTVFIYHFGVYFANSYGTFSDKGDDLKEVNVCLLITP